ncbi:hypothetical protein Zmor_004068 [Zophobas morio]|uniref:Uncharacterized protein n=1 Tax=Zophobas morio TaxID=2755281 RepID=A0AA38HJY4_9CUCU|nr:hypothetical protein Zmor_004068 [Zophobas morio]
MSTTCTKCERSGADVHCDLCKNGYHGINYSGLSRSEVSCLKSENRKLKFYCENCSDIKAILNNMVDLSNTVKSLQEEVNNLKFVVKQNTLAEKTTDKTTDNIVNNNLITENIVVEIFERKKRETNLIVYNVEESNGIERKNKDFNKIKSAVQNVSESVATDTMKIIRLGKYSQERNRPIKVIIERPEDVHAILKNKTKFPYSCQPDRTPMQR